MSESRHSRNIPIGGHFPALGMPDRPFVMSSACGSTRLRDSHATSAFPFRCPLGDRGPVSASGPALSNGTGYFRRSSRGPRRTEGCGEVRRGQRGLIVSGESASAARQQSNDADPLSVGFSTRSTRMQAACPPCNTLRRRSKADWRCARVRSPDVLSSTSYSVHHRPHGDWWALAEEVH